MTRTIYLDHNATTPLDARVLEAMMPYLTTQFGNPSSTTHEWGNTARKAVEEARSRVAALLEARPEEIVFTSGATESNNLGIKGAARFLAREGKARHLVVSAIEHPSVLETAEALTQEGFSLSLVSPDASGLISPEAVAEALGEDTGLVSVMAANGEVGTLQPVSEIARICRERGAIFHTDATQMVGKLKVSVDEWGCHLLSLTAHKFYGPKGVGALYVRSGTGLVPLVSGGGQERGLRPGTLNVPGIVGLGTIAGLRPPVMEEEARTQRRLRDLLWKGIQRAAPGARINGHPDLRLPGCLNLAIPGVPAERLLTELGEFAFSAGSACHSEDPEPSAVLAAMGVDRDLALSSVRFGLGRWTTEDQIRALVTGIASAVGRIPGTLPPSMR